LKAQNGRQPAVTTGSKKADSGKLATTYLCCPGNCPPLSGTGKESSPDECSCRADTRRFYECHGFADIQPGKDHRMLCYLREL
jgi:hypothetical protein